MRAGTNETENDSVRTHLAITGSAVKKPDVKVKINHIGVEARMKALPSIKRSRLTLLVGAAKTVHTWPETHKLEIVEGKASLDVRIEAIDETGGKISSKSEVEFTIASHNGIAKNATERLLRYNTANGAYYLTSLQADFPAPGSYQIWISKVTAAGQIFLPAPVDACGIPVAGTSTLLGCLPE